MGADVEGRFFREMTLRICGSLDIAEALSEAFEVLRRYIPADVLGLGFNDPETGAIRVVAKVAAPGASWPWSGDDVVPLSRELLAYIAALPADRPTTVVSAQPADQPQVMHEAFPGLATDSLMFQRLEIGDEVAGALLVSVRGLGRYTPQHGALLETIREPFAVAMVNARRYRELEAIRDRLAADNRSLLADITRGVGVEVVGADFGLREVMHQVRQVARTHAPTLLLGETGTGKEVVAHAIHNASNRRAGPLISLQCGAIPETLLDSELFGHEKGAFTGALERKRGRFERADGGTLFLDEIGELTLEAQVKLLRVLQEQRFERVGGTKTVEVDVRVIAATHRDLEGMVRAGTFREDLWYRLSVFPIRLPPLRLRREDIPSLVRYFVARKAGEMGLARTPRVRAADLRRLERYDWPGNVRELQNVVERGLILSSGDVLEVPELASPGAPPGRSSATIVAPRPIAPLDDAIREHIVDALERVGWQVAGPGGAAEHLGVNPSTLRSRMAKLGIRRPRV